MITACFKELIYNQYLCFRILRDSFKKYRAESTKKPWRRYLEAQQWLIRQGEFCKFYYAWGLNSQDVRLDDFIGRKAFLRLKAAAEEKLKQINELGGMQYDVITKDKFVAESLMEANGIPCISHHGIIVRGEYLSTGNHRGKLEDLLNKEGELFFKNVALEAGDGVFNARKLGTGIMVDEQKLSWPELMDRMAKGVWLVQSKLVSHASLRKINGSALNTTRIVTILSKSGPMYLNGFQAFATGNARTDSWSKGAVYVGIDVENESLKEYGIYHPADPTNSIASYHPDSQIVFKEYKVPFLKDAVQLCIQAHRLLYNNFIIGWDVAITDQGPVIVEANEKPGINAVQCVDGGCKQTMLACYKDLLS